MRLYLPSLTHTCDRTSFRSTARVEDASLMIALSGDYRSKKEVAYTLIPAIGRHVIDLGRNIEKGRALSHTLFFLLKPVAQAPTFKLISNSLILGSIELISEAYTVAEKSRIGQTQATHPGSCRRHARPHSVHPRPTYSSTCRPFRQIH
jgi:hypothetical protein